MDYTLAMENGLLKVFYDFKQGLVQETSTAVIQNLLRMYQPPHITSVAQLKAVGVDDPALFQQLATMQYINQTAEELAPLTRYKLVLSEASAVYPAVKLGSDVVSQELVMTLKPGDDRTKAHAWLKALLDNARTITLVDRYLCVEQTGRLKASSRQFLQLLPKRSLSIFFSAYTTALASEVKQICHQWKVKQDSSPRYTSVHDRYLLIDGELEVVVTSGIEYLFDTSKECTLLVRKIN
ncbi:MAG: hypothetical protein IBX50_16910 [Marinospirillum sp.]|uniref:hypothetical protein n=1 Tax=Marinospirillum sp. TaxID=2183934 RepID=UPI0019E527E9|nr:hypothetical protein [Marinospirillum sp.]MBE0508371.1 hypothetical protein [Marinospirillum sp.]